MGTEPLLHRIKIGLLAHEAVFPIGHFAVCACEAEKVCDLSWAQSYSFWGCQLCCCSLNQELGRTCGGQMLEKAALCGPLALGNTMWAK